MYLRTSWYCNLRKVLTREEWDRIRRKSYADAGYKCAICGANGRLNCHEVWIYNDTTRVQKLEGFTALCDLCHHVKHMGHAGILSMRGELNIDIVIEHFLKVNNCERETFEIHQKVAFDKWRERSTHEWKIDLGQYENLARAKMENFKKQRSDWTRLIDSSRAPVYRCPKCGCIQSYPSLDKSKNVLTKDTTIYCANHCGTLTEKDIITSKDVNKQKESIKKIRILAFSDWRIQKINDIFNFVQDLEEPVDFILYGGDDINRFEEKGVNYFTELSKYTKQGKVLAVIGNDEHPMVKKVIKSMDVQDLHEESFVFQNFVFIGLEASTRGPAIVQHSEKEVKEHLKKQYDQIKGKRLIILSHTPPYDILDIGIRFAKPDEGSHHIGSTSLRDFIQQNKVDLVICGHCHSQGGLLTRFGDTTIVNVSSHDSPGAKGIFALIDIDAEGQVKIEMHDTFEKLEVNSLRHLHGIGPVRESILRGYGIKTIKDIAEVRDLEEIAQKSNFSKHFLEKLQLKAKSVLENKTHQIAPFTLPEGELIFFDIETDLACERVWLIGIQKQGKFARFYADDWSQEKETLQNFLDFLKENPKSILVSFSGRDFDKNVMQCALIRLGLDSNFFSSYPHFDLCQELRRSFIFPNQSFALKDFGTYLKYPFKHPNLDGWSVALEYLRHVEEKKPLDPKVLEYNEDDVKALPFIIEQVIKSEVKIKKKSSEEIKNEIEILKKLRAEGYTLQQLANKFNLSISYIYSRLNSKYLPHKARELPPDK